MYKARPPSAAVAQVVVISLILSLAGCAANQTTHTGYLNDYAALVSGSDSKTAVYLRPGLTPGDFKQLSVDMVAFAGSSPRVADLSDEERNTLKSHLMQSLQRVMSAAESASTTQTAARYLCQMRNPDRPDRSATGTARVCARYEQGSLGAALKVPGRLPNARVAGARLWVPHARGSRPRCGRRRFVRHSQSRRWPALAVPTDHCH